MRVGAAAIAAVLALASRVQGQAPSASPAPILPLAAPVEGTLVHGEVHAFALSLRAGSFLSLAVAQEGLDVGIRLRGPEGAPAVDQNLVDHRFGREALFLLVGAEGTYRVEIHAGTSPTGRYRLRADVSPTPTERDRQRLQAQAELAEARRLERQQQAESSRAALARYRAALVLWEAAEEAELATSALIEIGRVSLAVAAYPEALSVLGRALAQAEARADRGAQARAHQLLGKVAFTRGEYAEARRRSELGLALARQIPDRAALADLTGDVGLARFNLGETRPGIELVRESLGLWRELGDARGELNTLANLGACHLRLSEVQDALDVFAETLRLRRKEGNKRGEATTLANMAIAYGRLGERALSLETFAQAVALYRVIGERRHEAVVLTNMGSMHHELGNYDQALALFEQALAIAREIGERSREASVLRFRASLRFTRGQTDEAGADAEASARIFGETGDRWSRAEALKVLTRVRARQGRPQEARAAGQEAHGLHHAMGEREGEAGALYELARVALGIEDLAEARRLAEEALEQVEFLRRSVRSAPLRATYTATLHEYYELYVEILMRLHRSQPGAGYDAEAFRAAEQARGRGLLELLVESRTALPPGVDPALVERERELQDELSFKLDQQVRLLGGSPAPGQKETLADEIDSLTAEYEDVRSRLRAVSPKYAALTQPEPRTLAQIQEQVLDDEGTLLLEYALGASRSYLWAVTSRTLATHVLPGREAIEKPARRAYELLSRRELSAAEQRERDDLMAQLSRVLLGPLNGLGAARRVVVVADGGLQYVPFAALPDPAGNGAPLVAGHEVVGAPSASLLALLREEVGTRAAAPKAVAVLADPVFDARDPRLQLSKPERGEAASKGNSVSVTLPLRGEGRGGGSLTDRSATDRDLERAVRDAGLEGGLARLPFTRREARAILSLASPGRRREALDFEASRATATDPELASYRYLHFATHGFLNSARPELSGLVLSLVDRQGRPQQGFLAAPDVVDLRLNADLVVLSGCRTALGRELRGEGLVGLTRAFMYAGAPRVVASLWKVDDEATAELMKRFYQGLLRQGLRPAAALRAAQVAMSASRRFAAPYYWAAFQLQGEWN